MLAHGLISYRRLQFRRALNDFEQIVKITPEGELTKRAFYMQSWCDQMMGREERALATCREFVERFPASKWAAGVMFWIGEYEFNYGEYGKAEKLFLGLAGIKLALRPSMDTMTRNITRKWRNSITSLSVQHSL